MIITGMRISTAISIMALVGVEMLSSDSGIGFLVIDAQRTFDTERVFAGILVLSLLGFGLDRLARKAEARILRWHIQSSLAGGVV
jgi:ABC-type nitrate/sulfonate/bicarbonate transport system permease component